MLWYNSFYVKYASAKSVLKISPLERREAGGLILTEPSSASGGGDRFSVTRALFA
jgi:hypothetical protein